MRGEPCASLLVRRNTQHERPRRIWYEPLGARHELRVDRIVHPTPLGLDINGAIEMPRQLEEMIFASGQLNNLHVVGGASHHSAADVPTSWTLLSRPLAKIISSSWRGIST